MSTVAIINNTPNNVFPQVFSAERENGAVNYQWAYALVEGDPGVDTLVGGYQYLFRQPGGDEYICFCEGDQRSTAADYGFPDSDTERKYGPGELYEDVISGATSLTLIFKNPALASGADACIADGDNVFITDRALYNSEVGNFEKVVVSGAPVVNGDGVRVTISFTPWLVNGYAAGSVVASFLPPADISTNLWDNLDETGITGTTVVDLATAGNMVVDSVGALEMTITITITGTGSTFDVTTDYPGVATLPSGNTTIDYAPENSDLSRPYFTMKAGSISTGEAGDSFSFQIHPPARCIIQKKVTPAGSGPVTGANCTLVNEGEA